ncbi:MULTISPECIES: YHYH domain-containing protein [Rhizobium]|nr:MULTISPECIES: YHYH domain-containing protein [Rhizobium]MBX4911250.1 YHYH domain-containing protein [Rhizobium bangladeshense]MBX5260366.1 YHYH domain-containing protein [Rhizobium sp. NLR16b]MBX5266456.1 YHYH domain-containing protein [Rhizobium sp. NLR16a]MBX5315024.1 YHYH domain-containing protein [Rhizobium sp. NLR11b]QTU98121.1 YHYH domain-containing protein [Rhizobium sp. NLR16a]
MKVFRIALAATVLALSSASAFAHGGGLDKNGCHTNHKTGDYHCH